jgi:hypothetical protein
MSAKPYHKRLFIRRKGLQLGHPEPLPLEAAILALDAAKCTGAALYLRGELAGYDEVNARNPDERRALLREALHAAEVRGLPLAVIAEAPFGGHASAALSLTATVSLWRDSCISLRLPASHFLEIQVGQWRAKVFGRRALSRVQAREWETRVASSIVLRTDVRRQRLQPKPIGPDAAAAICMGSVAMRSSGIRAAIGCELVERKRRA